MAWIGPTEAARRLRITRQSLADKLPALENEGQARRENGRWKIRTEGLEVAYDGVTRSKADSPRAAERASHHRPAAAAAGQDEREDLKDQIAEISEDHGMSRAEAERQIKVLQRRLLQLDVAEREGQLVDAGEMTKVVFERGRRVRDLLMGLPVRIAADLAAEDDPARVSILLEQALVESLTGLADAFQS